MTTEKKPATSTFCAEFGDMTQPGRVLDCADFAKAVARAADDWEAEQQAQQVELPSQIVTDMNNISNSVAAAIMQLGKKHDLTGDQLVGIAWSLLAQLPLDFMASREDPEINDPALVAMYVQTRLRIEHANAYQAHLQAHGIQPIVEGGDTPDPIKVFKHFLQHAIDDQPEYNKVLIYAKRASMPEAFQRAFMGEDDEDDAAKIAALRAKLEDSELPPELKAILAAGLDAAQERNTTVGAVNVDSEDFDIDQLVAGLANDLEGKAPGKIKIDRVKLKAKVEAAVAQSKEKGFAGMEIKVSEVLMDADKSDVPPEFQITF